MSVCFKARLGEHQDLARAQPERFYIPAYIGPRGWAGLRLDRGRVKWSEVEAFVRSSYAAVAPKTLSRLA